MTNPQDYQPNERLLLKLLGVSRVEPALVLGDHGFVVIGATVYLSPDKYTDMLSGGPNKVSVIKAWATERFDVSAVNIDIKEYN
jgi:hypothetical protein